MQCPVHRLVMTDWCPVHRLVMTAWCPVHRLVMTAWCPVHQLVMTTWCPVRQLVMIVWCPVHQLIATILCPGHRIDANSVFTKMHLYIFVKSKNFGKFGKFYGNFLIANISVFLKIFAIVFVGSAKSKFIAKIVTKTKLLFTNHIYCQKYLKKG